MNKDNMFFSREIPLVCGVCSDTKGFEIFKGKDKVDLPLIAIPELIRILQELYALAYKERFLSIYGEEE